MRECTCIRAWVVPVLRIFPTTSIPYDYHGEGDRWVSYFFPPLPLLIKMSMNTSRRDINDFHPVYFQSVCSEIITPESSQLPLAKETRESANLTLPELQLKNASHFLSPKFERSDSESEGPTVVREHTNQLVQTNLSSFCSTVVLL